jgi:BlaI family penicillinase repressor
MAERVKINETEWDVLDVLWTQERATARQVTDQLHEKRGWAVQTVKTTLDRMVDKGLVAGRQVGNVWEYTAALPRTDARRSAWAELVAKAFGGETTPALHFLATEAKLPPKELAKLRALLEPKDGKDAKKEPKR